jgi:photosystem II stability/assembly factor-like uncharacterized protein
MTDLRDSLRNRPGLPALSYRIGDYTSFRRRLLNQLLSRFRTVDIPPQQISLEKLTTRDPDDPAIALLDAVAVVADVLTFYQERIANEGFLNTATERRSVLELVRAIGYELNPGVAASTVLAFTVDDNPGSPEQVIVPKGTQVLSIPGQDELPQTFETSEDLPARADWNALRPRDRRPQRITRETRQLYLAGLNTQLQANDPVLLVDGEGANGRIYLLTLASVEPVPAAGYTRVTLRQSLPADLTQPLRDPQVFAFRDLPLLFGNNAQPWNRQSNEVKRANGGTLKGGVFHLATNSTAWTGDNTGLPNVDILCLTRKVDLVFAGTPANGIFRSKQRGEPWQAVNNGLTNLSVQTLYTDPEQGHLYAGTPNGGVFRSKDDGENWSNIGTGSIRIERQGDNTLSINTGLPNAVVRSLLTLLPPAITVSNATISDINGVTIILAGTEEGIYRSVDQGKNWQLTSSGTIAVHALAKLDQSPPLPGRFSSSGTTVTSTAPSLSGRLQAGDLIRAGDQIRKVETLTPNPTLTLESPLNPAVTAASFSVQRQGNGTLTIANRNTRVVGTDASGFQPLRRNDLLTVEIEGQTIARRVVEVRSGRELIVDTAFINRPPRFSSRFSFTRQFSQTFGRITQSGQGSGVVTSSIDSTLVIGNNETRFQSELLDDGNLIFDAFTTSITLEIQGQSITRRVERIISDRQLIVESPFLRSTLNNVGFSFARQATGRISSNGATITGTETAFATEVQRDDLLIVNNQTSRVVRIDATVPTFTVNQAFQPDLSSAEVSLVISRLYAGSDRGVLLSTDFGKNWTFINNGLGNDRDVRSLLVTPDDNVHAGTAGSQVFRLTNDRWNVLVGRVSSQPITALATLGARIIASTAGEGVFLLLSTGDRWATINTGILSPNVTCLSSNSDLLAGSRFTGFVEDANNAGQGEWHGFAIDATTIDLDALYPRILPDSWVVLRNNGSPAVRRVKALSTPQLNQFNLSGKVTRLQLDQPLENPSQFNRRTTTLLATSEPLSLVNESLTIAVQQSNIFFDPIQQNTVYLSEFVAGLEAQKLAIVTGKRIRILIQDIAGVFHSTNAGDSWTRSNTGLVNTGVTALARDTKTNRLYAGTVSSGVFRSSDNGATWEPLPGLPNTMIQTLAVDLNSTLFAGTSDQGAFRLVGEEWQPLPISSVHRDVRAIAISISIVRIQPAPQPVGSIQPISQPITIQPTPQPVARLPGIPPRRAPRTRLETTVFAGTINGGVFCSSDNGATWTQTTLNNTDVQALVVDRSGQVFAATASGQVFRSRDRGVRWEPLGEELNTLNLTALALSADEQVLFAGTAGSGVFRCQLSSSDSPSRWEPVNTRLTDLTIRCLSAIGSDLFAGTARGGLFRSSDNSDLWALVNAGITSLDAAVNPDTIVNTDVRAIVALGNRLFAAGVGILVTADGLTTVPLKSGNSLHLLTPPTPLQGDTQRWQLQDKDGVTGVVISTSKLDIALQPATAEDPLESELAVIKTPPDDQQQPVLQFVDPIQGSYDPETVRIHANVARATHGETQQEVLGSGDGAATNQSFVLKKPPLTFVSAATPSGAESTLEVRVNGVRWQEVPSLYQRSPQEQAYIVRRADDGTPTITFGDGSSGARLPSGQENVTATYRSGIGLAGLVGAERLSLLKTRPLGVSEVTNPLPATGAADPETMTEARASAPLTVRTLDRIVSLQDYEDFARAFAGIGKAQAVVLWNGETQQVHITVAAIGGAAVTPGTPLYDNLVAAIDRQRDPLRRVQVDSYEPLLFNLEATLLIDPDYLPDQVIATVRTTLTHTFAFEKREFAQPVTASEAIAAIQAVQGIIAVDLDTLYRRDATRHLEQLLPARPARLDPDTNQIRPAQLLLLNPAGIVLGNR